MQIHGLEIGSMRIIVGGVSHHSLHSPQPNNARIFPTAKLKSIHFNSIDDCFVTKYVQPNEYGK